MVKKRRHSGAQNADTRGGTWIGLPQCVFDSVAYRSLDFTAKAALTSICSRHNGYNNGRIVVSYRQMAADHDKKNMAWIGPAIAQLMEHGLVDIGAEAVKGQRRAREYRITFISTGEGHHSRPASNEYRAWVPN